MNTFCGSWKSKTKIFFKENVDIIKKRCLRIGTKIHNFTKQFSTVLAFCNICDMKQR